MKRGLPVILAVILAAAPITALADFDYSILDEMSEQELNDLWVKVQDKIVERKSNSGEYPYEAFTDYEDPIEYHAGDTWIVPSLWSVTIDDVQETSERSDTADENPAVVYLITYTYENIGYDALSSGFNVDLRDPYVTILDSAGEAGYTYGGLNWNGNTQKEKMPIGGHTTVTQNIGLNHSGPFTIQFNYNGNHHDDHIATFYFE